MRTVFTLLALSVLAGCGGSEPFPRTDFPQQPGNYLQFFTESGHPMVEFVQVDASGESRAASSGVWNGQVPIARRITNQSVMLAECGVVTFREDTSDKVSVSYSRVSSTVQCPFNPFPAVWTRVGRAPASN